MKSATCEKLARNEAKILAQPVLKWAGGKSQLLDDIEANCPQELGTKEIETYIEPFVGSGAVFFALTSKFYFKKAYLFDINPELIILYNSLKADIETIIAELAKRQEVYLSKDEEGRKEYFYETRNEYNEAVEFAHRGLEKEPINSKRAAITIFLNRTCFNGLFRVNSKAEFNVPFGRYKNPTILFESKLRAASEALQNASIELSDFSKTSDYADKKAFVYYDPPYRPISKTASFTSYSKDTFDDAEQARLCELYRDLSNKGVKQLLSNSDPTNHDQGDYFFDDLYKGFKIVRVAARRVINSDPDKRGDIRELLIRNY